MAEAAEADGIRFAYRRFGVPGRPPLVFFQHFMGTLDDHDPAVSDAFAGDREVILFNNAGVASSSGIVPGTIEAMARDAIGFIHAELRNDLPEGLASGAFAGGRRRAGEGDHVA